MEFFAYVFVIIIAFIMNIIVLFAAGDYAEYKGREKGTWMLLTFFFGTIALCVLYFSEDISYSNSYVNSAPLYKSVQVESKYEKYPAKSKNNNSNDIFRELKKENSKLQSICLFNPVVINQWIISEKNEEKYINVEYKNISNKNIKYIKCMILSFNKEGKLLYEFDKLQELVICSKILDAKSGTFSENMKLVNSSVFSVKIQIIKVFFEDNSVWAYSDNELISNFDKDMYYSNANYFQKTNNTQLTDENYWVCKCNVVNTSTNSKCVNCGTDIHMVMYEINNIANEKIYKQGIALYRISKYEKALELLNQVKDYRDTNKYIEYCENEV